MTFKVYFLETCLIIKIHIFYNVAYFTLLFEYDNKSYFFIFIVCFELRNFNAMLNYCVFKTNIIKT